MFSNVTKTYSNGTVALSDLNLFIDKGEFVFVVGSSGAGKSSLIKLIMKEENPDSGKIIINQFNVTNLPRRHIPKLRRSLGVVFQDFRLLPNKTIYENVAFAMQIAEATPREIRRQVPFVLSLVGLAGKAKQYPHQVSGGEQQRASLARALANNPSLLIADEPTGNLDPEMSLEIVKILKDINSRGTTILMATHAKDIVNYMKKRVIELDRGKLVRDQQKGVYGHED